MRFGPFDRFERISLLLNGLRVQNLYSNHTTPGCRLLLYVIPDMHTGMNAADQKTFASAAFKKLQRGSQCDLRRRSGRQWHLLSDDRRLQLSHLIDPAVKISSAYEDHQSGKCRPEISETLLSFISVQLR